MTRVDPRTQVRGPELAGAVAQGDVRRREPESQGSPEPSDRSRDRQEESKSNKTEEKETATARTTENRPNPDRRRQRQAWQRRGAMRAASRCSRLAHERVLPMRGCTESRTVA